jgi:hypothetical protein
MAVTSDWEQRDGSSEMPHLHLPIDHTDADLVLAANLAEIVGCGDLYVAWSHASGAGAVPEVEAVLVEAHRMSALAELVATIGAGFAAFWRALLRRRSAAEAEQAPAAGRARRSAGAGEPSV